MIVLTDGAAYEDDKTREQAVAVAKKIGIKIYTIGIGPDGISLCTYAIWPSTDSRC